MKKLFLALSAVAILGVACKKEETGAGTTPLTTEQKITGNWKGDQLTLDIDISGTGFFDTAYVSSDPVNYLNFAFNADGTLVTDSLGLDAETTTWSVVDDNTVMIDGEEFNIDKLTSTEFDVSQDSSFNQPPINFSIISIMEMMK